MEQGSPEWVAARLGKLTASRLHEAVARTKTGWAASRANLMAALIAERLTGTPQATYSNAAMAHGVATEPLARVAYAFRTDYAVAETGFIDHPVIAMSGASPDGLVGDSGLVEIKCPNTATHLETLLGGGVGGNYFMQMQWQMACSGRLWCDFVSFDPRMPETMRLHVTRVNRDRATITELEQLATDFLAELDARMDKLTELYQTTVIAA
jgi:putative phage-type endonuclease